MGAEPAPSQATSCLTPDAQDHFQAASLILRRYGLNLAAAADQEAGHDVLMARAMPRNDLEYKHVLADLGADGALGPRLKTSYYRGEMRVILFETNPPRAVLQVEARPGDGITVTVLDPSVPIRLCMDDTTVDLTAEAAERLEAV